MRQAREAFELGSAGLRTSDCVRTDPATETTIDITLVRQARESVELGSADLRKSDCHRTDASTKTTIDVKLSSL